MLYRSISIILFVHYCKKGQNIVKHIQILTLSLMPCSALAAYSRNWTGCLFWRWDRIPEVEPWGLLINALHPALAIHLTTCRSSVYSKNSQRNLLAILPLLGLGVAVSVSAGLLVALGVFFRANCKRLLSIFIIRIRNVSTITGPLRHYYRSWLNWFKQKIIFQTRPKNCDHSQ